MSRTRTAPTRPGGARPAGVVRGLIVGAGAQGRIVAEVWRAGAPAIALAFLDDDPAMQGQDVLGIRVVGPVGALPSLVREGVGAILAIGNNRQRLDLAARWGAVGPAWTAVVHPSAVIMPSATVGGGAMVFAHAVVNSGAHVGAHVIVNTAAIVEHDSVLEDGASLGPGVSMGGRVTIERGAFVSAGVTLAPRVRVGAGTVVGAGACVVRDLPPGVLAYGVPARVVRPLGEDFAYRRLL